MPGDKPQRHKQPAGNREQYVRIAKYLGGRFRAGLLVVKRVDITKSSIDYEWRRVDQRLSVMRLHRHRTHRVQAVRQDDAGGRDHLHLIKKHRLVMIQYRPVIRSFSRQRV